MEKIKNLNPEEKNDFLIRLRNEIDKVDSEISRLLIRRIQISMEIGTIKKTIGLGTYDARRENEIDENINKLSDNPEIIKSLKRIYERIIDECRAIQREREK
jgi:chorismate mutase/prephenate dehydratase